MFINFISHFFYCLGTVEDAGTETRCRGAAETVSDRAAVDSEAAGNHCSSECQSHPSQREGQSVQVTPFFLSCPNFIWFNLSNIKRTEFHFRVFGV